MRPHPTARRSLLCVLIAALGVPPASFAAQLPLAQYPAGSASRQPAPNVILSMDDSGSMGTAANSLSGMRALKTALHTIFDADTQVVPDGSVRLGWNTFNQCQVVGSNTSGCHAVRVLDAAHRARFLTWVGPAREAETAGQLGYDNGAYGTPTHETYNQIGQYLRNASVSDPYGPWAEVPGTALGTVQSCRRNYVILMTDGEWNVTPPTRGDAYGNHDSQTMTLPDGELYDAGSPVTRLYRSSAAPTLADLAFYYWSTDLATGLANNLAPQIRQPGSQTYEAGGIRVALPEYWNPRNNPATWQNITTYTIGFRDASSWAGAPVWDAATNDTFGGDFPKLVTGAVTWANPNDSIDAKRMELWQMALAGRGRFIPATDSDGLIRAFQDIFSAIVTDAGLPVTSFANSASSVAQTAAVQYTSGYEAAQWTGHVKADTLAAETGAATPYGGWGTGTSRTTADKLDALTAAGIDDRLILTWRDLETGGGGTSFEWASGETYLSTAQKALLKAQGAGTVSDAVARERLNFIRGDRRQEGRSVEGVAFRTRGSRQGDIVNSALWYVAEPVGNYSFDRYADFAKRHAKRLPMVYVGGNDGMLHGFSGADGSEKLAYVPKGVIANLPLLTRSDYQHRYYVDGSPFSGDVNLGNATDPDWRTLLVGTLGAGGKGYFVLDVTAPGSTATDNSAVPSNLLKANAEQLVVMDKTAAAGSVAVDADIGHIMANPVLEDGNPRQTTQIVRMNDGRWAAVMGNGYNSTSERPVLLIQYLDGDRALVKIAAGNTAGDANGLSAPRLVDINGDGTPDVVYAGDLHGNLWKFDVSAADPSGWGVAFGSRPLYTAVHTEGSVSTPQPITSPPLVRANDRGAGGLMVAFGTGRNLTEGDRVDTSVQTVYAVLDNTRYKLSDRKVVIDADAATPTPVGTGVSQLVEQRVDAAEISGTGDSATRTFWTVSQNDVQYTGNDAKKGWYLNLPERGERMLGQMSFYDGSNNIELISLVPGTGSGTGGESCSPSSTAQKNFRTLLNIMDGKRPSVQILDTNGDGYYNAADRGASRMVASGAENRVRTGTHELRISGVVDRLRLMPETPLRPSWRQLQ
ncbi:pilus assembly protein [Pseudorhodoferax sp.]|uniref:pilus assembly protein n=1 Tax=Pseudorhodoferax sp. TaxID=1993553 RepID=UPI0039E5BADF